MDTEIILIIASSVFVMMLLLFLFSFVLKYQKSALHFAKEKELMQSRFDQALLETQLEIQEQTLQHISSELHDNLGQIASLIKINLFTVPVDNPVKATEKLAETKDLTRQLIADIKSLSVSLSTDKIARIGLTKALEAETERIKKTDRFEAFFEQGEAIPNIPDTKAIIIYRMAQEILNNTIKHSEANTIRLLLTGKEDCLVLKISDNGKGFDVQDKIKNGEGAGLNNLHKRALLINARLEIQSSKDEGTTTTIEIPTVAIKA